MKLAAAILAGGNREDVIGDAIRSVSGFVDGVVFICTDESADEAIRVGAGILDESNNWYDIVEFQGEYTCCADGRNLCLRATRELSYDWCCILDTDERLHVKCDMREVLTKTKAETVRVWSRDGVQQYTKDRFIRTDSTGEYRYPVHECFIHDGATEILSSKLATFSELPKTPEQTRKNAIAIEAACREWLEKDPGTFRAAYYIADSLDVQGRKPEAIEVFKAAASMAKNDTEHGEAMLRVAQLQAMSGQFEDCRLTCLSAMFAAPDMPEFPWLMAMMHVERGQWGHALDCANMAIALGRTTNLATVRNLLPTLKVEIAHTHGPWAIRAKALRELGMASEADEADRICQELKR